MTRAPTAPRPGAPPSARARVASRAKEALRQAVAAGARALLAATPFRLKVILREALELTERLDYGGHDLRLSISSRVSARSCSPTKTFTGSSSPATLAAKSCPAQSRK